MDGWMDGRKGGWKSGFKDCLQQSKILALAGLEPHTVEAKISKSHALPSELAGSGSGSGTRTSYPPASEASRGVY